MNTFTIVEIQGAFMLDDGIVLNFPNRTPVMLDVDGTITFVTTVTYIDADNHYLPGISVDKFHIDSFIPDFN